jgi:hypothetical protein
MGAGAASGTGAGRPRVCERVFVSIKGRPYTWLRASLQRGDLAGVRSAASELRQINLADALAIVLLMSTTQDPAYQRAATRWLTRLASERPSIGLQDLHTALDALQALATTSATSSACPPHTPAHPQGG